MNTTRIATAATLALALGACTGGDLSGGGSGYSRDAAQAPAAALPANPYTVEVSSGQAVLPEPPTTTAGRLVVDPQFDFGSSRQVLVSLDMPEARGVTANLNVCLDWESDEAGYTVDYRSCLLRADIVDGRFEQEVTLANQYDAMLAVVHFDDPERPAYYRELVYGDI